MQSRARPLSALALGAFLVAAGCGNMPAIPTIDEIRVVPDTSQSTLLLNDQFSPRQGPVGTVITVYGRGKVFPAGIVNARFSGTGSVEFDLPEPTSELKIRVPQGTASGPFGFTISGRRAIALENALPSSNVFEAWRIEAPGFIVTNYNGVPSNLLDQPPNDSGGQRQHPPPNSANLPSQADVLR
jgi:hypothetical protein